MSKPSPDYVPPSPGRIVFAVVAMVFVLIVVAAELVRHAESTELAMPHSATPPAAGSHG